MPADVGLWSIDFHPVILDAAFQTLGHLFTEQAVPAGQVPLPTAVEKLGVYRAARKKILVEGRLREPTGPAGRIVADLVLSDEEGCIVAEVQGFQAKWVDLQAATNSPSKDAIAEMFYRPSWTPAVAVADAQAASNRPALCLYPSGAESLKGSLSATCEKGKWQEIFLGETTRRCGPASWEVDLFSPTALSTIIGQLEKFETVYFLGGIQATKPGEPGASSRAVRSKAWLRFSV